MEETESDESYLLTKMKNGKEPCTITISWQILVGIISMLLSFVLMINQSAGSVPVFLTGYLFLAHGILLHNLPEQKCLLSVAVNGHQFNQFPLRKFSLYTCNIIAGLAGFILTMIFTNNSFGYIIGLFLSILILIITIQAIFDFHFMTQNVKELERFSDLIENLICASWKRCRGFIDAVGRSLPLVNDDAKQLIFSHKAVHAICIVLGMILSMAMFSAQIWSVNWDDNSFRDPENFFARYYVDGLFGQFHHSERVIFISILSVFTFLVSITLMCLLTRTTYTRLLLFSFLAFGIGVVFILFSAYTIQFIILMGRGLPGYFEVELVYLSIFICVPFLGSLFMALSYSSIIQMCGDQNVIKSTSTKTWLTCIGTLLAILVIFLAAFTMCSTNWMTMMAVQQNWNSTENPRLDADCVDEQNNYYNRRYHNGYNHNHRIYDEYTDYELPRTYTTITTSTTTSTTTTTTTTTQRITPEKCYGQELDFEYQRRAFIFSLSHLSHIESLLFLSFFILLTGKKIMKMFLFPPGFLLFVSSILTMTFGKFTTTFGDPEAFDLPQEYVQEHPQNKVFILNCISIGTAFITGVCCLFVGNGFLINLLAFIFKFILFLTVFLINIILTLHGCVMKTTGMIKQRTIEEKHEHKFGTEQESA